MFESYGSEVYMSMSADSTCRGLRTTRDGPLVLRFTKGALVITFSFRYHWLFQITCKVAKEKESNLQKLVWFRQCDPRNKTGVT